MVKRLVVFIISLMLLAFIAGWPPVEAEPVEPEPNDVEPSRVEPNDLKIKPTVSFHDKCADILKTFVDDKGMVDYKTLRRKRLNLKSLLQEFDNLDPNEYRSHPVIKNPAALPGLGPEQYPAYQGNMDELQISCDG